MAVKLALLEGCSLFVLVCSAIFVWGRPLLGGWIRSRDGHCTGRSALPVLHHHVLLQRPLRPPDRRNFGEFASRLVKALGITFFLLALLYAGFPRTKIVDGSFVTSLLMIGGFVLPLRAMFYATHAE